ncbi:MAG TPA: response regulator transcription factor [Luteolibacter sp.]|nr:response regulator transcription factor [Luteolibacter sp.]
MSSTTAIRVLLVDDHLVVRMGLGAVLKSVPGLEIVGEAEDVEGAVEQYRKHLPDVALMDLRLPGGGGIEALKIIRGEFPEAKVVMFTTYDFEEDIHRALQAGAAGYLLKNTSSEELAAALVSVHERGSAALSPEVSARLAERDGGSELTAREQEVLGLVVKGLTNKDIARVLGFTPRTAKAHVTNLLLKLGVSDRTEATAVALQRGIVSLD